MNTWERVIRGMTDALDTCRVRAVRKGKYRRATLIAFHMANLDGMANRAFMRRVERYRNGI